MRPEAVRMRNEMGLLMAELCPARGRKKRIREAPKKCRLALSGLH